MGIILLLAGIGLLLVGALRGEGRRGQLVLAAGVVVTAAAVAAWGPEWYTAFHEGFVAGWESGSVGDEAVLETQAGPIIRGGARVVGRLTEWLVHLVV